MGFQILPFNDFITTFMAALDLLLWANLFMKFLLQYQESQSAMFTLIYPLFALLGFVLLNRASAVFFSAEATYFRDFFAILNYMGVELSDRLFIVAVLALDLKGLKEGIESIRALDLLKLG